MSGRVPMCEQPGIAARLAEIQRERVAAIAGCRCPQRTTEGLVVHVSLCPLGPHPAPPSQMSLVLEAMQRARARTRLRSCTCAPSEAPRPCPHKYALSECWSAANTSRPDGLATRGSRLRQSPREASPGEDARARLRQAGVPIREDAGDVSDGSLCARRLDRLGCLPAVRGMDCPPLPPPVTANEIIAEGIAAKYARHRVLS